jgi:hypothetical protein
LQHRIILFVTNREHINFSLLKSTVGGAVLMQECGVMGSMKACHMYVESSNPSGKSQSFSGLIMGSNEVMRCLHEMPNCAFLMHICGVMDSMKALHLQVESSNPSGTFPSFSGLILGSNEVMRCLNRN